MNIERIFSSIFGYLDKDPLIAMAAIATILTFVTLIFKTIFKAIIYRFNSLNKFSKRKEEYKQAKELIHLIEEAEDNGKKPHPFLIEKGYAVLSGDKRFNSSQIICCLNMDNPSQALKYFSSGFYYLEYSKKSKKFVYRKSAESLIKRRGEWACWVLMYIFSGTVASYVMLSATTYYARSSYGVAIFLTIVSIIFAVVAIIFMSFGMNIRMAEKFMKLQDEMFKESDSFPTITNKNKSETEKPEAEEPEAEEPEIKPKDQES